MIQCLTAATDVEREVSKKFQRMCKLWKFHQIWIPTVFFSDRACTCGLGSSKMRLAKHWIMQLLESCWLKESRIKWAFSASNYPIAWLVPVWFEVRYDMNPHFSPKAFTGKAWLVMIVIRAVRFEVLDGSQKAAKKDTRTIAPASTLKIVAVSMQSTICFLYLGHVQRIHEWSYS